jgi:hypothetical protein
MEVTGHLPQRYHVPPHQGLAQRRLGGVEVLGAGRHPDAGLRRRVLRFLLVVVVETLGKKGHSETLGIAGTADEEECETHQQHPQHPASHAYASPGVDHRSPRRSWHSPDPKKYVTTNVQLSHTGQHDVRPNVSVRDAAS